MRKNIFSLVFFALAFAAGTAFAADIEVHEVYAEKGMVSSAHELASRAGVEIMEKGGNAIDAAIATMLALNVVEPNASGIGGGGFMTIRFAETGEVVALDYRETAPASATKDMFASDYSRQTRDSLSGGKSVGVPGIVLGIFTALERYGTMSFAKVAEPAIRLAEEGFEVHRMQTGIIADNYEKLSKYNLETRFMPDGLPAETGTILKQPELAKAFRMIAKDGSDAFYKGPVGEAVVVAVNRTGGNMTMEDLSGYEVLVHEPIKGSYRGYSIYSTPPASSGGTHIVQLLNIMERYPVYEWRHNSAEYLHHLAEAMKLIFADRQKYMADTAFVKVPLVGLVSKEYAKLLTSKIKPDAVMTEVPYDDPWPFNIGEKSVYLGGGDNTHNSTSSFSVVDVAGNIVASTNTVNFFFGSGVVVPEYGIVLNNEMDDFAKDPASVNAPEPGKRPLSSMSPTVVLNPEGKPFMTLGAAGATRIIATIAQIIMNVVDFGMPMDEAIEQARVFNFASGGQAGQFLMEEGVAGEVVQALGALGHDIQVRPRGIGTAQGILIDHEIERMNGGADSRRLGVPVGF